MKKLINLAGMLLLCLWGTNQNAYGQDVILQGFYWNTHPGDLSDVEDGGVWWDSLATVAPKIGAAGFSTIWAPPPQKGFAGKFDMGYGPYDFYDLGEYDSKGTIRTRHGNVAQLQAMIQAYHNNGIKVMADVVLNHRGGGDAQVPYEVGGATGYLQFNPPSGRLPGDAGDFHPNNFHGDQNAPYHNPLFFEDICYFNNLTNTPPTDAQGNPSNWYFGAPNYMGEMGVDLISWGRYLMDEVGFDELRLDAIKHIEPDFLGKFIIEVQNGDQPFALGEFFDYNIGALESYHNAVVNSSNQGGVKGANMSLFDFPLRGALAAVLNDPSGNSDLYSTLGGSGLVWGSGLSGFDVVTWLDTHDTDRKGFVEDNDGCQISFGNSCLKYETLSDHHPIFSDKEDMGYPFLMAAEGRPIVFWKDYFWFNLDKDINWLITLRNELAKGTSDHIQHLNGYWPQDGSFDGDNHGGNMFAMTRNGLTNGATDGMILGLNDHPTKTNGVYVNTPFANKHLKDYSDGFLFETTEAFADGRALIKAQPRDYSWYAPTGLYPIGTGKSASHFNMGATPGGCAHFVALNVANASNYLVNNAPIEAGDEVAAVNSQGDVVGIGRIGQGFQWDGVHDMIIEILGAPSANGMGDNEALSLVVFDQSQGQEVVIGNLTFASSGTVFNFSPDRPNSPNRNGNNATFALNTTAEGTFICNGITLISGFGVESCAITNVETGTQTPCNIGSNQFSQELTITYENAPMSGTLQVNEFQFSLTGSPQTITLSAAANGAPLDVNISIVGADCELFLPGLITAPEACNETCGQSSPSDLVYDDGWQSGDNDGEGFGPWALSTSYSNPGNGGHFVYTSTANGNGDSNGDGDIDALGEALGLYANSGDVSNAVRPFTEGLSAGASLAFDIDNGWIDNGGTVGFGLQNTNGDNLMEFYFSGGNPNYILNDGNGANATTIGFTDEGMGIQLVAGNAGNYELAVTTLENGTTYNFQGQFNNNTDQIPAQVRFFNANAGFDGERNYYVGGMEICHPVIPTCEAILANTQFTCPGAAEGSITIEMTDGLAPYEAAVNGGTPTIYNGSLISLNGLSSGLYDVVVTDANGCHSELSVIIEEEDLEPPVITCPANIAVVNDPGACGAIVNYEAQATDNCSVSVSYSQPSGSLFAVGSTEVLIIATDLAGNTDSCTFIVEVTDVEPPAITCPENITVTANNFCEATVTWDDPVITDNCTIAQVSSTHQSGHTFPEGSWAVEYEVTDSSGNTSSCFFKVTVKDYAGPEIEASLVSEYSFGNFDVQKVSKEVVDNCDEEVDDDSVMESPEMGNAEIKYYQNYWISAVIYEPTKNRIKVIDRNPESLYQSVIDQGMVVQDGQYLIQKTGVRNNKYYYYFNANGTLIGTTSAEPLNMITHAVDGTGNSSTVVTPPSEESSASARTDQSDGSWQQLMQEMEMLEELQLNASIFPNPATSYFHVNTTDELGEEVIMKLYDQSGRLMYQEVFNAGLHTVQLETLSLTEGLYMVHLIGTNSRLTKPLMIR